MANTILEALYTYFRGCPLMQGNRLNIDYLPADTGMAGIEYSISTSPAEEMINPYFGGGARCRYQFIISSVNDYGADEVNNMLNSGYYEQLAGWLRRQQRVKALPNLPTGLTPLHIRAIGLGYLYQPDVDAGKYQIQCEMIYYREGDY